MDYQNLKRALLNSSLYSISKLFFIAVLTLVLAGCSEDNFPKYSVLSGLRILALKTENQTSGVQYAEASPGDTVRITPYISDFQGTGTVTYTARACFDPGVSYGAEPSCEGVTGAVAIATDAALTIAGTERTGIGNTFDVTIPGSTQIFAGRSQVERYNGVSYLVTYVLASSTGATVKGFKRIIVSDSSKTIKNQNPSITGIANAGVALASMPTTESELGVTIASGSAESYSAQKDDGSLTPFVEELEATWFITDGTLKYFRTTGSQTTLFTPPSPSVTGHTPLIVVVVRDGRGGVAVYQQSL